MRDYLALLKQDPDDVQHGWGSKIWDEAKVMRDEGGQFASKSAQALKDAAQDLEDKVGEGLDYINENAIGSEETLRWRDPATGEMQTATEVNKTKLTDIAASVLDKIFAVESTTRTYNADGVASEETTTRPLDWRKLFHDDMGELKHYGVLGMKWGRRRTDAQIAADTKKRAASGEKVTPSEKAKAATKEVDSDSSSSSSKSEASPGTKAITGVESSAERYSRLSSEAKAGKASQMSEQDLKFFNARTEALAKVNKLTQSNPSWLRETSKKVLQTAAQNTMQSVADGVAKKYISGPLLASLPDAKTPKD